VRHRGRSTLRRRRAVFDNVFLPPEFDPSASTLWAIHLGAVVSPLSAAEADLVSYLNEANPQLVLHRSRVAHIDYAAFELQGDYRELLPPAPRPILGEAPSKGASQSNAGRPLPPALGCRCRAAGENVADAP